MQPVMRYIFTIQECLLLLLYVSVFTFATSEKVTINRAGSSASVSSEEPDLFLAATWAPLNAITRADLYLAAAAAGKLGEESYDLIPAAQLIEPGEFPYGNQLVRGAMAIDDIPPSVFCAIGEGALISVSSMVRKLGHKYNDRDQLLSQEIDSIEALMLTSADERAILTLLIMREASRTSSPFMPYIMSFLHSAHEHIPSSWDPGSTEGGKRRSGLGGLDQHGGPALLNAADELRRYILNSYETLVPRALKKLPRLLGVTGPDVVDIADVYTIQRFAEIWLAIRSRSFQNNAHGMLVPLACLMNHPPEGQDSNVEIRLDTDGGVLMRAKRHIQRGEQLTYSYGDNLSAERALLVYGFPISVWSRMPLTEGFQAPYFNVK